MLPTLRQLGNSEINEEGAYDPALLDAVITKAIQHASEVFPKDYEAPEGDSQAKREALAEMDQVAGWLDDADHLDGVSVAEARRLAMHELELADSEITATAFGRKVHSSRRWKGVKLPGGKRVIQRRPPPEEMLI